MRKLFNEFKEFAIKGNAMNLAVGVIIGAAFQGIVNSLTNDIISPIIGLFADTDFSEWQWVIKTGADGTQVAVKYGSFITAVINFFIMAMVIFLFVKFLNHLSSFDPLKLKNGEPEPEPTVKKCPFCQSEIDIKATRCPHCTSLLEEAEAVKAE